MFKRITGCNLVVALIFTLFSAALAVDIPSADRSGSHPKPSGVLASAAAAAAAAADAAGAAANAANAAAKAAAAALEALNSIMSPSQRGVAPAKPDEPAQGKTGRSATSPPLNQPAPINEKLPDSSSAYLQREADNAVAGNERFVMPAEQSLVGLFARFEIPVFVDTGGEFANNLAANQAAGEAPANIIGETNLAEAIRAGRSFSRDNLIAAARTEQAKAQTGQALGLLLPSVAVRANGGKETSTPSVALNPATGNPISSETHNRADLALTVRQPLFDLPGYYDWRRRGVIEQARNEGYRSSDGDAYLASVNAYFSLVSSRLQADLALDFEKQLKELFVYIEKRASAGAASVSDMARVRARSQGALSSRLEQESAHTAAGVEFVRLTNLVPKMVRLPELEDVGASLLPETLDRAVNMAMVSNPEISTLTAEMQAAKIDMAGAKGRFLPRLDLEYTDNYSLHAGGDTSSAGQRDQRFMMVMNWTLFSGGRDYRFVKETSARYDELKYRLDDQRRRIVQALSADYATLASARERLDAGYRELKSISIAAEAMSKRMLSGNQSLLDLLDVYDRYYQARVRLVNLHILEMSTVALVVREVKGVPALVEALSSGAKGAVAPKDAKIKRAPEKSMPSDTAHEAQTASVLQLPEPMVKPAPAAALSLLPEADSKGQGRKLPLTLHLPSPDTPSSLDAVKANSSPAQTPMIEGTSALNRAQAAQVDTTISAPALPVKTSPRIGPEPDLQEALQRIKHELGRVPGKPHIEKHVRNAEAGDPKAFTALGWVYRNGIAIPADMKEALKWYRLGAAKGNLDAQLALGWLYFSGEVVEMDRDASSFWYGKAAEQGSSKAVAMLKKLGQ